MKRIMPVLFSLFTGILNAQTFEIPAEEYPFYEIIEWKGQGAMLMNRDPSFNQKQVHLTYVAEAGTSSWQGVFNPFGEKLFYIAEDGGKYVYFLNNFEFKDGKIVFHQLNNAGYIKSQSLPILAAIRKVGSFDVSDLILTDVVTTEKALVYLLSHTDKSTNKKTTIALTMTHNNLVVQAFIVSENITASAKIEDQISWYVAGEDVESIVFAARVRSGKNSGWQVKRFTPKGEMKAELTVPASGIAFAEHNRVGFGTRGSAWLKVTEPKEQGTLVFANGNYYVGGIEVSGTAASLVSYLFKDKVWTKASSSPVKAYNAKKTADVGFFPMKEGIGWYVGTNQGEGHFHSFTSEAGIVSGTISQQTKNPSRLLTAGFTDKFVVAFPSKWLLFAPAQLPKTGAVTFEYVNR